MDPEGGKYGEHDSSKRAVRRRGLESMSFVKGEQFRDYYSANGKSVEDESFKDAGL